MMPINYNNSINFKTLMLCCTESYASFFDLFINNFSPMAVINSIKDVWIIINHYKIY